MAKPRIFISSTYYDLRWIRRSIEQFVESMGYEATVFESGDVPFSHSVSLDESCYREIAICHMLVLVIGGRYGSSSSDSKIPESKGELEKLYAHYNSVTKKEYEIARAQDIPIYIFVEKGVLTEYETYKKNRGAVVLYAHVDSVNIFRLLDDIYGQSRNNLVREFSNADDITSWLREQWAGMLALYISQRRDQTSVGQLKSQIDSLTAVVDALKSYSEQLVRKLDVKNSEAIITRVEGELQSKKVEATLRSVPLFAHLFESHDADPQELFEVLAKSGSLKDFGRSARRVTKGICASLEYVSRDLSAVKDIIRARKELGLEEWKSAENDLISPATANSSLKPRRMTAEERRFLREASDNRTDGGTGAENASVTPA